MLGCSGMLGSFYRLPARAIGHKVARARARAAKAVARETPVPMQQSATTQTTPKRVLNLKFPLQTLPKSTLPSGWLDPLGGTEGLPFQFTRTPNKQLPVYSDLRNGGSRRLTVLRRYTGDVSELTEELRRLLGEEAKIQQHNGRIEVNGHHVLKLKRWLRRLGF